MENKLSEITVKIQLTEIIAKTKLVDNKKLNPNLLANATLVFRGEMGEYFTITGFTIWKSKYEGINVCVPRKGYFKFCLFEESIWKKIKKAVLDSYDYESMKIK
jgi:hypothetical protein